jgi:hypothetical protein
LRELGAQPDNLYGIDLLPHQIQAATEANPGMHFIIGNAEQLDFPNGYFDLVILSTVLSSVRDDGLARNLAREISRVLRGPDSASDGHRGAVLWFEMRYNNPWNPRTRGIGKREIRSLFPGFAMHLHTTMLLPPLARRLGPLTPVLYPALGALPPLRGFYVGLLVKSAAAS